MCQESAFVIKRVIKALYLYLNLTIFNGVKVYFCAFKFYSLVGMVTNLQSNHFSYYLIQNSIYSTVYLGSCAHGLEVFIFIFIFLYVNLDMCDMSHITLIMTSSYLSLSCC